MKILRMKLFQETACYKKPFAFKVAETYPLPPYSTVIGMVHKILKAECGEYYDVNVSVQGRYESIFSNYQNLRMFKGKDKVTSMPRNVHQLLNINLIIHIEAEDDIIDKIYNNVVNGYESFSLGRNEDIVRVDEIKIVDKVKREKEKDVEINAYVPEYMIDEEVHGINYRLNSKYVVEDDLRKWEKINVKYVEGHSSEQIENVYVDNDNYAMYFMKN